MEDKKVIFVHAPFVLGKSRPAALFHITRGLLHLDPFAKKVESSWTSCQAFASHLTGKINYICLEFDSGLSKENFVVQGLLTCPVLWDTFCFVQPEELN